MSGRLTRIAQLLLIGVLLQGCAAVEETTERVWLNDAQEPARDEQPLQLPENAGLAYRPDSRDRQQAAQERAKYGQRDPLRSGFSPTVTHKRLNDYAEQLAMSLVANARGLKRDHLVGVASFVRLSESLEETTIVGNQLAEYLMGELQSYGVAVVDFKLANNVSVTPHGDLALSRNGEKLAQSLSMDHIVTGTMIEDQRGVRVNARIIAVDTQQLVASAQLYIPAFMVQSVVPELAMGRTPPSGPAR